MKCLCFVFLIQMTIALSLPEDKSTVCGRVETDVNEYIAGGRKAREGERPWMVGLRWNIVGDHHLCGGSIIDQWNVVTAAHCHKDPSKLKIRYNTLKRKNGTDVAIDKFIVHPQFNKKTYDFDIAVIQLKTKLILNQKQANPICMPKQGDDLQSGRVHVSGWGRLTNSPGVTLPDDLMTVEVPVVTRTRCKQQYSGSKHVVTDNMVCAGEEAGGKDACNNDSGGGLVTIDNGTAVLRGIVSTGDGCAKPHKAGIYTRVGNFVDWINKNRKK